MEEKGGVLHIFFIFVGIALLGLGIFYYCTDEKIKLDDFDNSNTSNTNTNIDDNGNDWGIINVPQSLDTIMLRVDEKAPNTGKSNYHRYSVCFSPAKALGWYMSNGSSYASQNEALNYIVGWCADEVKSVIVKREADIRAGRVPSGSKVDG